jgi:hypothetical protein
VGLWSACERANASQGESLDAGSHCIELTFSHHPRLRAHGQAIAERRQTL